MEKRRKALLVVDEQRYYEPLIAYLGNQGEQVTLVSSCAELERHIDAFYDYVLLDLLLHDGDTLDNAIENISAIRSKYPFVPILVVTQHADLDWVYKVAKLGATGFLQKPKEYTQSFFDEILVSRINEIFEHEDLVKLESYRRELRALSEDDLISKVIIPLFRKMHYSPAIQASRHGPFEQGLDLLPFYEITALGRRRYYGVQAKACDINANVRSPDNITVLLSQAEEALHKTFLDPDNQPRRVDEVILITSGNLNNPARAKLENRLEREKRLIFIDGDHLLSMLRNHDLLDILAPVEDINQLLLHAITVSEKNEESWIHIIDECLKSGVPFPEWDSGRIFREVCERERLFPRVHGDGFALPHLYCTGFPFHVIMLLVTENRRDWIFSHPNAVDSVILYLASGDEANNATRAIRKAVGVAVSTLLKETNFLSMSMERRLSVMRDKIEDILLRDGFTIENDARVFG